jgi:hypothetical protein
MLITLFVLFARIDVQLESEATPFVEDIDTVTEPRQQGKQPPIGHIYKIPIPSQSRLCMK